MSWIMGIRDRPAGEEIREKCARYEGSVAG